MVPAENGKKFANLIKNSKIEILNECGHMIMFEKAFSNIIMCPHSFKISIFEFFIKLANFFPFSAGTILSREPNTRNVGHSILLEASLPFR